MKQTQEKTTGCLFKINFLCLKKSSSEIALISNLFLNSAISSIKARFTNISLPLGHLDARIVSPTCSLNLCNVRCGKGYLRYPWSATSLPSNTSDDINSVSCQPIQTPLTAITGKMSLVVSSQYALSYALGDDFFNELNGLQKTIEYEFTENNASAIMAIKIPNSKFDDDDFDNIIKQITADLPEDDFQVVESSSRRRLLTYHQILQSQFVIISSDTVSSPATLSQRIKRIENEVLVNRQGNIIEKVEDVTPKRMYHLPQVEPPRQGISFDIALIIGLSSFGAIVVLLLLAKLCPSKTSST